MGENVLNPNNAYQLWMEWLNREMTPDEMFFLIHFGWQNPQMAALTAVFAPFMFVEMKEMQLYYEKFVFKSGDQ